MATADPDGQMAKRLAEANQVLRDRMECWKIEVVWVLSEAYDIPEELL